MTFLNWRSEEKPLLLTTLELHNFNFLQEWNETLLLCKIYFFLQPDLSLIIVHFSLWVRKISFDQLNCSVSREISISSQNQTRLTVLWFPIKRFLENIQILSPSFHFMIKVMKANTDITEETQINISIFPEIRIKHSRSGEI